MGHRGVPVNRLRQVVEYVEDARGVAYQHDVIVVSLSFAKMEKYLS